MVKKDLQVVPFVHNNPEAYETRGYLADRAMKMVVMQSFQNAPKVLAESEPFRNQAVELLGIDAAKVQVLQHVSLETPREFAAELDEVLERL